MLQNLWDKNLYILLYAVMCASLFFDAILFFDVVSVSRAVSILLILVFFFFIEKANIISAFKSMSLVILLLVFLFIRSFIGGLDFSDPYFYALFFNLLMAIAVAGVLSKVNQLEMVFLITFAIVFLFSVFSFFGWGIERSYTDFRASFMSLNQNEYSALLLIGFASGLYYLNVFFQRHERTSLLSVFGLFIILVAIFSTGSRLAIIGSVLSNFFYAALVYYRYGRRDLSLLYFSIVFIVIAIDMSKLFIFDVYEGSYLYDRLLAGEAGQGRSALLERFNIVNTGVNQNFSSLGGRIEFWSLSIKAYLSAPWIGLGYEGFRDFLSLNQGHRPHNALLEALAIGGGMVFIFVMLIVRWVFRKLRINSYDMGMTFIVIFPLAIISMMLNVSSLKLFWLYLAVSVSFFTSKEMIYGSSMEKKESINCA